jgi:alcohol dehydrogenase
MPQPADWSFEQGAAFPVQTLTAWYALHQLGAVRPRATVLVHSAAGGVGLRTLQLLQAMQARVIATVGSPDKVDFLQKEASLDLRQIILRDRRRFGRQLDTALSSIGQSGLDLVLDSIAGPYFWPGFERLNPGGRLVIFGSADFMPKGQRPNYLKLAIQYARRPRIDPLNMISDNRSVMAFNLIWLWDRLDLLTEGLDRMRDLLERPPHVGRIFEFEAATAALRYLQSGQSVGKVVLRVNPPA